MYSRHDYPDRKFGNDSDGGKGSDVARKTHPVHRAVEALWPSPFAVFSWLFGRAHRGLFLGMFFDPHSGKSGLPQANFEGFSGGEHGVMKGGCRCLGSGSTSYFRVPTKHSHWKLQNFSCTEN